MGLGGLTFRAELQSQLESVHNQAIIKELDKLISDLSAWLHVQHNDDGTHNVRAFGLDFVPVGGMIRWALATPPTGWLNCDGSAISRTRYPLLFKAIGISSGPGDGTTTFNIPVVANFIILAA